MADLKVYHEEQVRQKLAKELPRWYLEEGLIQRLYQTDGWQTTMMLVNAIWRVKPWPTWLKRSS
jgi:4a-hydroxytetrahydrobiopterin dehydratase